MLALTHLASVALTTSVEVTPEPTNIIEGIELEGEFTDVRWWVDLVTGPLLRTLIIIVGAILIRYIFNKIVDGFVAGLSKVAASDIPGTGPSAETKETAREVIGEDLLAVQRKQQHAASIGQLLKNLGSVVILTVAAIMVLGEWGFNVAPLLAGAGIIGVALAFGAQTLVADFLSGVFMLLEDQYGVGDIVDVGEASGTVEDIKLRVTKLRAVDGVVWWVRNGEIIRVGNMSQNWARAVLDVSVAYGADIAFVRGLMADEGAKLNQDEEFAEMLLEDPEIWGVEELGADGIAIRIVLKTLPGKQWSVARELRERLKARFDAEGVEIPFPQRTVWVRQDSD